MNKSPKVYTQNHSTRNQNPSSVEDDVRVEKNARGQDTYIFDPYNPVNRIITKTEIETLLHTYGINAPITNIKLFQRAFVHRSYTRRPDLENQQNGLVMAEKPEGCVSLYSKSNERMEFVGDGVLECATKFHLYRRFPKENEGFMTEKKIALVKNEAIGRIAYEMGLHRWVILSRNAEAKQTRVNLKKLGCLFEAFLGAIFLDFNKVDVRDEDGWFQNVFLTGPGFQMAQVFIENVFEKHVDWINLIRNDDNYKNILQVMIQKEFKTTPDYLEIHTHHPDVGYHMGVYLCLGQPIFGLKPTQAAPITRWKSSQQIHEHMALEGKVFLFLGEATHKIKKKAEQVACEMAIAALHRL